jgi:hypothetical protein
MDCASLAATIKTPDNVHMPIVPSGFVHQGQLDEEIKRAASKLGKEVFRVAYRVGEDSTGEPSIFFRIVLVDSAANEETLVETTSRISTILFDEVRPIDNWGLHPYFNFRSLSEQRNNPNPEWE